MNPLHSFGSNLTGLRRNRLALAAFVALAMSLVHNLDHILNQQDGVWPPVGFAGASAYIATGGTLWLGIRDEPFAPLAGLVTGLATAIGFAVIHLAPDWGALSDSYSGATENWLSFVIVYLSIAAGLILAAVAAAELFGRRDRAAGAGAS
jgi:hypothetical protein